LGFFFYLTIMNRILVSTEYCLSTIEAVLRILPNKDDIKTDSTTAKVIPRYHQMTVN